jgi:2-polyprenyl-6-methoxyphenol hydroxylase-like FAD-dependent oxidoreductase
MSALTREKTATNTSETVHWRPRKSRKERTRSGGRSLDMTLSSVPRYEAEDVERNGDHAVVIGGSMAGLLAGRVLSDAFEGVTVIERDPLPDEPSPRRGVPQGRHVHVLLESGRATLEDFFPGFGEDLLRAGGLMIDGGTDLYFYNDGGYLAPTPERMEVYCASRPLIEHVVRQRLEKRREVQIRDECQFIDYLVDEDAEAVGGVVVREGDSGEMELHADLVVDATGRTSRTPSWLEGHGYDAPRVDDVHIDVTYSSIYVERPPDDRRMLLIPPSAPRTCGGAAFLVEGDRWLVTLSGVHDEEPPSAPEKAEDFASKLPTPELERLLARHQILPEEVHQYPFPSNRRRRYEELERFPTGLLVIGDAIASYNPIYGQGMSVAALEALQLHHTLKSNGGSDLALPFYDRAEDVVDIAWKLAVGGDFEFEQTTGPKPRGTDLFNRYLSRLFQKAHRDGTLTQDFYRVLTLEQPPTSLLRPGVMRRVLV